MAFRRQLRAHRPGAPGVGSSDAGEAGHRAGRARPGTRRLHRGLPARRERRRQTPRPRGATRRRARSGAVSRPARARDSPRPLLPGPAEPGGHQDVHRRQPRGVQAGAGPALRGHDPAGRLRRAARGQSALDRRPGGRVFRPRRATTSGTSCRRSSGTTRRRPRSASTTSTGGRGDSRRRSSDRSRSGLPGTACGRSATWAARISPSARASTGSAT